MRAVRVRAFGAPPELEEVPRPERPAGHTRVRVAAATVGHLDRTIWSGGFIRPPALPYTPGVEGSGIVVESDNFEPGERVWLRGGGLGVAVDGTWAEEVLAPDVAVGPLPAGVSMDLGAVFFSPCTSAWVSLHEVARVEAGERVLVSGVSGAVGSVAAQLAVELGASVTGVVSSEAAGGDLADGVVPLVVTDPASVAADPASHDLLIDPVGGPLLGGLLPLVRPGGRAVLVGYVAGTTVDLDISELVQRDVALLPLNMLRRESQGRAAVPQLLDRLAAGTLSIDVTGFDLDDAASALDWLVRRGRRGRALLRMEV